MMKNPAADEMKQKSTKNSASTNREKPLILDGIPPRDEILENVMKPQAKNPEVKIPSKKPEVKKPEVKVFRK